MVRATIGEGCTITAIPGPRVGEGLRARLLGLTNHPSRGDLRDDGTAASSGFAARLGRGLPAGSWALLARAGSVVVGWCLLESPGDFSPWEVGVYVHPGSRRRGVGGALVRRAMAMAGLRGAEHVEARPWNAGSRGFYGSLGASVVNDFGPPGRWRVPCRG